MKTATGQPVDQQPSHLKKYRLIRQKILCIISDTEDFSDGILPQS